MNWSDNFYADCADRVVGCEVDWYRYLCDKCFPGKWWENVTRNDMIEYLKDEADIQVKNSYAQISFRPDEKNLIFEVELTSHELNQYYEDLKEQDVTKEL